MKNKENQNKVFVVGFLLIILVAAWALAKPLISGLRQPEKSSEEKINAEILKAPLITSDELLDRLKNNNKIFLLDLSSPADFSRGHIKTSANIDPGSLTGAKVQTLGAQKTSEIIIINQGDDAYTVARKTNELITAGYANTKYLEGGIADWKNQGNDLISPGGSGLDQGKTKKITMDDLKNELSVGVDLVQFLDVRSSDAYQTGHIPGALNIPVNELEKNQDQLASAKKVVVYGQDENEAKLAASTLFDLNHFNIYVLDGGLNSWKIAGGKIE